MSQLSVIIWSPTKTTVIVTFVLGGGIKPQVGNLSFVLIRTETWFQTSHVLTFTTQYLEKTVQNRNECSGKCNCFAV